MMAKSNSLLIATHNPGKKEEFAHIFNAIGGGISLSLQTLDEVGITAEVEETGTTYAENAQLKATAYMRQSGLPTLADDSGLEVAILNGEPGIYSARYGGVRGAAQLEYLLSKMEGIPFHQRVARFVCVIALSRPDGVIELVEGTLHGVIECEPRGTGGFGYDPLFYLLDEDKTMAELSPEHKNAISHRAVAARKARPILARWQSEGWFGLRS
jgi:XTP/dITP diphosphohydrolase